MPGRFEGKDVPALEPAKLDSCARFEFPLFDSVSIEFCDGLCILMLARADGGEVLRLSLTSRAQHELGTMLGSLYAHHTCKCCAA